MYIYKITNKANGKIYIGKHIGENLNVYFNSKLNRALNGSNQSPHLFNAIRKYGPDKFVIESLVRPTDKTQMDLLEKFFIRTEDSQNSKIGYNIQSGGEGGQGIKTKGMTGRNHSEKTKKLMREKALLRGAPVFTKESINKGAVSIKGKKRSSESIEKTRMANLGVKRSEEAKANMSAAAIERCKKFPNPFLGRHHSEATKNKIRATKAAQKELNASPNSQCQ